MTIVLPATGYAIVGLPNPLSHAEKQDTSGNRRVKELFVREIEADQRLKEMRNRVFQYLAKSESNPEPFITRLLAYRASLEVVTFGITDVHPAVAPIEVPNG